jgi:hypothetical protein
MSLSERQPVSIMASSSGKERGGHEAGDTNGKGIIIIAEQSVASGSNSSGSSNSDHTSNEETRAAASMNAKPKRMDLLRTATMFEPRVADHHNRDKPLPEWTLPPSRHDKKKVPRAATLFLGKDHERWQQHEREAMNGSGGGAGLHLAWKRGTASLVQSSSRSSRVDLAGEDDYDDEEHASLTGESSEYDDDDGWMSSSSAGPVSRRSSRRGSSNRASRSQSGSWSSRVLQTGLTGETSLASSTTGSDSGSGPRIRRFSSNGPEAAFLRHETVIGIHTPRRESLSERLNMAPLSQIQPLAGSPSRISPQSSLLTKVKAKSRVKPSSSSELLAKQAAEAEIAASIGKRNRLQPDSVVSSADEGETASLPGFVLNRRIRRSPSPRMALKLAKRRKPIRVDGTLYDRSGPFREGAVTDGLSVRLFSAEDASESDDHHHMPDQAVADEEMVPTTYLITTPDNRVSSAAKLRRWAMDGHGHFYAAMEIKSIEAKMRAADSAAMGPTGQISKGLLRELRDRYLEDLLDEVQKAETLNPGRAAVAKVLRTSDGKYVRLEEDYPEEAFFVIAGCDETELYPAIALVFCQAVRAIVGFHSAGWLHGDIKLENLMFDERGNMVVIDYENANPFRGVRGGDGRVTLVSYDWIPPEAFPGPHGRRTGPSADLWALGCNMVRAFALRDQIEDHEIRETLLGRGQLAFLAFRKTNLLRRNPARRGSDIGIPGSLTRPLPTSKDVDLSCLLEEDVLHDDLEETEAELKANNSSDSLHRGNPPPPGPSPKRLLSRFAREAPQLLKLVIARCITELPEERSTEAEVECMQFADALEHEQKELGEESTLSIGARAVRTAIELSGSAWVKPKLESARQSLGLGV